MAEVLSAKKMLENRVLLTPGEVAEILRISRRAVYEMIDAGELSAILVRKNGRGQKIKTESVLAILEREN